MHSVFAIRTKYQPGADERAQAFATIRSCTGQRRRTRWSVLRSSSLHQNRYRPISSRTTRSVASGGHCKKDQRSFSNASIIHQCLDFSGHQDGRRSAALCTLTNEVDWITVKQLISAGMIKENGHRISDFGTTAFRQWQPAKPRFDLDGSNVGKLVLLPTCRRL